MPDPDEDEPAVLSRLARRFVTWPASGRAVDGSPNGGPVNGFVSNGRTAAPLLDVVPMDVEPPVPPPEHLAPAPPARTPARTPIATPDRTPIATPDRPRERTAPDGGWFMSKQDELGRVIADVRRSIPELYGVMVASTDGLSIAHDFPEAEAEKVAAMAATALGLGRRITERTNLGGLQEAVVRGDQGYVVVYGAGESAVLVMSGPPHANLGLMRIEARSATVDVRHVLG